MQLLLRVVASVIRLLLELLFEVFLHRGLELLPRRLGDVSRWFRDHSIGQICHALAALAFVVFIVLGLAWLLFGWLLPLIGLEF
ncbi:hypothetical protein [Gemmobacter sp.]|uniref:hypothetical protein n=1 Tax=Gemmobacter sp. TaxID=1898957 RepID=UPI002AFEC2D5|nr:hypothetical protein [Gemmobacter sp.]